MNKKIYFLICINIFCASVLFKANAQCTWQTILTDSFEYQTPCPDIIAGTTVHTIPQSFAPHSGTFSLYLNFINCTGTTGTCAGDTVYKRHFSVCRNMEYRFSSWFTTSFSGTQCDMRIVITDGSGTVLNLQTNVVAPYAPSWIQYSSGGVTPADDDLYFIMITNVGGGNGNDLSMDDFVMEQCYPNTTGTSVTGTICSNLQQTDLFNFLPVNSATSGTWTGPGTLTGGYLGTFTLSTSQHGSYIYSSAYYGTNAGCPLTNDTVTTALIQAPAVFIGNDTTICSTQSIILNASSPGSTYLWSNGSTAPGIAAGTTISSGDTIVFWVTVTNAAGCFTTDSIEIIFENCSSINSLGQTESIAVFPNPSSDFILVNTGNSTIDGIAIYDSDGKKVKTISKTFERKIFIGDLKPAVYYINITANKNTLVKKFLKK